jgi:hypothetical protein
MNKTAYEKGYLIALQELGLAKQANPESSDVSTIKHDALVGAGLGGLGLAGAAGTRALYSVFANAKHWGYPLRLCCP